jgi:hypothetical protein
VSTIPGVSKRTAIMLLAECGADISVSPTAAHLASWAGICPGNNSSGGRPRSGRTRHGSVALRIALTEAAHAAARTKGTYLAAHHAHIRSRRGVAKAIGATRHDLLIAYWHVIHDGVDYAELGTGLGPSPTLTRAPHPQARPRTGEARTDRHPRTRRLTPARHPSSGSGIHTSVRNGTGGEVKHSSIIPGERSCGRWW